MVFLSDDFHKGDIIINKATLKKQGNQPWPGALGTRLIFPA